MVAKQRGIVLAVPAGKHGGMKMRPLNDTKLSINEDSQRSFISIALAVDSAVMYVKKNQCPVSVRMQDHILSRTMPANTDTRKLNKL